ncbi:PepSY domain-containing protein [Kribbella jiaozuonensis]|uniref:PepSY domain-containing protein n=1 Tax=Kribbella jiaozuonensis TaxID=2575441 RepID=UPI00192D6314|nr:PepSY domain-containing protein [Kribbella jiaozuonensis]
MYPLRKMVAGSALAAAAVAGGVIGATMFGAANAATPSPSSSTTAEAGGRGDHGNETALTGDNLAKATAAAKAAVPGATVDRAETDADGAKYEVHMTKTDGSHVTVKLDASFKVTGTETGGPGGGGHGGGGGPHQANGITETPLTGDNLAKATAAAKAAVPGATVEEATTDADGAKYEVHLKKADGSEVTVKLDTNFKATTTVNGRG